MWSKIKSIAVATIPAAYAAVLLVFILGTYVPVNPHFTLIKVSPSLEKNGVFLTVYFSTNTYPVIIEVYDENNNLIGRTIVTKGDRGAIPLTLPLLTPRKLAAHVKIYVAGDLVVDQTYVFKSNLVCEKIELKLTTGQEGLILQRVDLAVRNTGELPAPVTLDELKVLVDGDYVPSPRGYRIIPAFKLFTVSVPIGKTVDPVSLLKKHSVKVSFLGKEKTWIIPRLNVSVKVVQVIKEGNLTKQVVLEVENNWDYSVYLTWFKLVCNGKEVFFKASPLAVEAHKRAVVALTLDKPVDCKVVALYIGEKMLVQYSQES